MLIPDAPVLGPDVVTEGLGAFDEIEFLGRGTFGETYRALRDDDEYAIKVIHHPNMPEYLWERELVALRRVDHPNVVAFRRSGSFESGGTTYPYFECEYIDGGSVRAALIRGERATTAEDQRAFLSGLLAGVAEIHDLGILHRDIKPENVALRSGDWGQPVLLDFGLARVLDMSSHTEYPARLGTDAYMAPEQLRGQPARRRSDLFAVGLVTYEAGTAQHPYLASAGTVQDLQERIQQRDYERPGEVVSDFAVDVEQVVMRLLSFRAFERLGVTEALRDLEGADGDGDG